MKCLCNPNGRFGQQYASGDGCNVERTVVSKRIRLPSTISQLTVFSKQILCSRLFDFRERAVSALEGNDWSREYFSYH